MQQRGGRSRFILALLVLTAVTLATLDARGFGPVESARGVAASILSPFRAAADWVSSPLRSGWNGVWGYRDLEEENAQLRAELDALRGQEFSEATARQVLEQYVTEGDLTFAGELPQVMGRIVAGPPNNFEETVTINRGSDHGIKVGMAAVTAAGLVGRVESVTGDRAVIQLVTDSRFRVGVRIVSSGSVAIVQGRGRNRTPEMVISGSVQLTDDDRVQTSGLEASFYPADIPVGRLLVPETPDGDSADEAATTTTLAEGGLVVNELDAVPSQSVPIELTADLDRLTWVTVLLWEPPS